MLPSVVVLGGWKTLPSVVRAAIPLSVRIVEVDSAESWLDRTRPEIAPVALGGVASGTVEGFRRLCALSRSRGSLSSNSRRFFVAVDADDTEAGEAEIAQSGEFSVRSRVAANTAESNAGLELVRSDRAALFLSSTFAAFDPAVREFSAAVRGFAARHGLTASERKVVALLMIGCSAGEIAGRLSIAQRTAEHHLEHVRAKLGVESSSEIVAKLWWENFAPLRGQATGT